MLPAKSLLLIICLSTFTSQADAASKTAATDDWCSAVRNQFVEAAPQFFLGPDPWIEIRPPLTRLSRFSEIGVLATVYLEGPNVRWLQITMQGQNDSWFETTHYFFDERGLLRKRERYLDQYASHIKVREDKYFENRKNIKTAFHDSLLLTDNLKENAPKSGEKENWDTFFDPDAPIYLATSDLPPAFLKNEVRQLAGRYHPPAPQPAVPAKIQPSGYFAGGDVRSNYNAEF